VPKIIINDTINLFLQTAISILVISNHAGFQVLFDKIVSVYFCILALEMVIPGNRHCASCIGTLSFLMHWPIGLLAFTRQEIAHFLKVWRRLQYSQICLSGLHWDLILSID